MEIIALVFAPFAGGLLGYAAGAYRENWRKALAVLVCAAEMALSLLVAANGGRVSVPAVFAGGLMFTTDGFRAAYAVITAFMWLMASVFSLDYFKEERRNLNRYCLFWLMTLGATEGVMLSGDLMTAFVFFEILSFTSFTWVIHEETAAAREAGYTYLFIAVGGGLVLFMGLALLYQSAGTLVFSELPAAVTAASEEKGRLLAAGICILFGFGAKAGMFPLHIWLPKAHPAAPSPASALLSGVLTKVGIYGILMTTLYAMAGQAFYGRLVLALGLVTMLLGAVLALFSVNLKRTLACSSMSQIGFILTGIAMAALLRDAGEAEGYSVALSGTVLHMASHSAIKLVLFTAAGVFVMSGHTLSLTGLKGKGRGNVLLMGAFLIGALGISGVPFFSGYISKTLLHEGILEGIHALGHLAGGLRAAEWVFLFSGGLTAAYMLKIFICLFVERAEEDGKEEKREDRPKAVRLKTASALVLSLSAVPVVLLGQPVFARALGFYMTGEEGILAFRAFSLENLKGSFISLGIGAVIYFAFVRRFLIRDGKYVDLWPKALDMEALIYRPLFTRLLPGGAHLLLAPFGENRVLAAAGRKALLLLHIAAKAMADGTDALLLLLRRTIFRQKTGGAKEKRPAGIWQVVRRGTDDALKPLMETFSFAMLMTCLGMLAILGSLVILSAGR